MNPKRLVYTITILLFLVEICYSQAGKVSGRVLDKDSQKPIPFANVFINNSSIGTVTDTSGIFIFTNLNQPAVYEIVVSFVGYESVTLKISVTDFEVKVGTILLQDSDVSLDTITVSSKKDKKWERNYKRFRIAFLGINEFAKACTILNPWVINFSEDEKDKGLIAFSDSPIEIENRMLGYKVFFYLNEFKSIEENYLILGNTRFDELAFTNQSELASWKENRKKAYQLSLQHLFKAMVEQRIYQQGFSLYKVTSTDLYSNTWVDTLKVITPTPQSGIYKISFKVSIEILYRKSNAQRSSISAGWIELKKDFILVNREGYEINPTGVITSGKLNDSRIANLLPIDYKPDDSNESSRSIQENAIPLTKLIERCYIHTDKPYYYPGETLWYKGYINYAEPPMRESLSRTMYVEFIDAKRKSVVLSQIVRIDSGIFSGDFVVPDTLRANVYYLRAYTNLNRNFGDDKLYAKPIPILYLMDRADPSQSRYQGKKHEKLSISTDKQEYKLRDKIILNLQTYSGQLPISANLSVSVTDAEQVIPIEEERDIVSSFLISEIPEVKSSNQVYPIEYGIELSGQFLNDSGKPKKAILNIIQIVPRNLFQVESNHRGFFEVRDLNFSDSSFFTYKPEVKSSKPSGKVTLLPRSIPKIELPEQKANLKVLLTDSLQREVRYDSLLKDTKLLNEVVVKGRKINTPIQVGTTSVYVIEGSEIKAGNIFINLMQVPRLRVVMGEGRIYFIGRAALIDGGPDLAVYVDGILRTDPATSVDALNSVNPNSILFVTVSGGAISVTTKPVWWDDSPKFQLLKLKGYSSGRKFQSIDYSDSIASNSMNKDIRSTIYWNPNVVTSKDLGQSTLSFYSADLPGRYRIVVEGVTEEGSPIRSESYIKIDDE